MFDGRLFFHKVIDPKNPRGGLTETRYIDPRKIRKIKETEKNPRIAAKDINEALTMRQAEYFLYNPRGLKNTLRW